MEHRTLALALATVGLAGCSLQGPAVPVIGPAEEVARLAGVWRGEYWSPDTGRSGEVYFRFAEGADSAVGDVLMLPAGMEHEHQGGIHPDAEYLSLLDVRVAGNRVSGHLAPYREPGTDCELRTTFVGTLEGDRIDGTFTSTRTEDRRVDRGRWRVWRVGSAS